MDDFSYLSGRNSRLDIARTLLGDDEQATAELSDAEINGKITGFGFQMGIFLLATNLLTKYDQQPDETAEQSGPSRKWKDRQKTLRETRALALNNGLPDPEQPAQAAAPESGSSSSVANTVVF